MMNENKSDLTHAIESTIAIAKELRAVNEFEESGIPKGYTCACGTFRRFDVYVYAHWDIPLRATCECGKVTTIRYGEIVDT